MGHKNKSQTADGQQGDTRGEYQGGGEDNGEMPSEIAAEQSPSPAHSRPAGTVDGIPTERDSANASGWEQPSSSNVTNRQFEEPAFRDQQTGSSWFYGGGSGEQERPQTYLRTGAGPGSECWNCGGDGLQVPYNDFLLVYNLAGNFENLRGDLHEKETELYQSRCQHAVLETKFNKSESVQEELIEQIRGAENALSQYLKV